MSDESILEAMQSHPDRAVTASELAELLGMSSTGILNRLDELSERGEVRKKKVGGRAVVWWVESD